MLHGEAQGFLPDSKLAGYDERTDFMQVLFRKGAEFEAAVVAHLRTLSDVVTVCASRADIQNLMTALLTFELMCEGAPIIHQGALRHAATRTYGAPDLLVRADVLATLFPDALDAAEARIGAPDIGGRWHYRVVDIKFTTLHLNAAGFVGNQGSGPAYKAQMHIYGRALAALQGYAPPLAYLLGRGWEQKVKGDAAPGHELHGAARPVATRRS